VTTREWRALWISALAALSTFAAALLLRLPAGAGRAILLEVRLPEALTAALVGGALGLSGLLFQLVLRNGLADPYVLGVAGGSTFGAVIVILALGVGATSLGLPLGAIAAFAGGLLTLFGLLKLTSGKPGPLLLGGVIANTAFAALSRVLTLWFSPSQLVFVNAFLVGFIPTPVLAAPLLLALPAAYTLARFAARGRGLDLLLLSDDEAASLGLAVGKVRGEALVLATLLAASAVALCGMVGFVGLVVPHAARLISGRRHRVLVPSSFLLGAAFLLAAHAMGKLLAGSWFLPVGVYTSLVGAPVFFVLLLRGQRRDLL
jgi:iron complex transport system permease protein